MTLQQIGAKHETSKSLPTHSFKGKTYLDVYESHFAPKRMTTRTVLEIGVLDGNSHKTWREYFPNAEVWGLDIDPKANRKYGDRIHIVTGSQDDPEALAKLAPGEQFDIVIDDGSHAVNHMLASFEELWPRVKSGGFYVIEDLRNTYGQDLNYVRHLWPGQHLNREGDYLRNNRIKMDEFFLDRIQKLDHFDGDMRRVIFESMQCFMVKV